MFVLNTCFTCCQFRFWIRYITCSIKIFNVFHWGKLSSWKLLCVSSMFIFRSIFFHYLPLPKLLRYVIHTNLTFYFLPKGRASHLQSPFMPLSNKKIIHSLPIHFDLFSIFIYDTWYIIKLIKLDSFIE